MMDATGSHGTANEGASAHPAAQDRHEAHPKPAGRAPTPHQAAATLRESSRALLATMDAVAELFELGRKGHDCSAEDGDRVAAMVEESRATLRGIVAGFAAADLQAAVTQATESARKPAQTYHARETGGPTGRTYAQAARAGAPPPESRTGTSSR